MSQVAEQEKELHDAMASMMEEAGFTEAEFDSIRNAVSMGATLGDVLNISKNTLESGYAFAYNLYTSGNYHDAETMFRGLCLYEPDDARYWMGLAGCLQARGEYALAIDTYGMAGVAGALKDPVPFYHGGLCYLKLNDTENAAHSFKAALGFGDDNNPAHKVCHDKVVALMTTLAEAGEKAQS